MGADSVTLAPRLQLEDTILATRDMLIARGVELPFELKRRDPKEPGRRRKEKAEDKLYGVVWRYFRRQKRGIKEKLEWYYPNRKTVAPPKIPDTMWDEIFDDDGYHAELLTTLTLAAQDGVLLFGELMTLDIDYTLVNTAAAKWARKYSGQLIKGIDQTTLDSLREAISAFVETPGMTIGDVMNLLPFTESRALSVAVTEITRAYGTAEEIAGKALAKEFPDLQVIKRWWTNNDDLVCPICLPLHGMIVSINDGFTTEDDKSLGIPSPPAHVNCRCWMSSTTRFPNV